MKYVKAFLLKFVMVTLVLWIILGGFYDVSFGDILTTSFLLSGGAFLIGDLFILPKFGNFIATVADFGLAMLGVWLLGALLFEEGISLGTAAFLSAIAIAIGEYFYHMYLEKQGIISKSQKSKQSSNKKSSSSQSSSQNISTNKYQTELGQDMAITPAGKKTNFKKQGLALQSKKSKKISTDQYQNEFGEEIVVTPAGQKSKTNKQGLASQPQNSKKTSTDQYKTETGSDMSVNPKQSEQKSNQQESKGK